MRIVCAKCGSASEKPAGAVNRAISIGAPLYCDRVCAGAARRKHKTKAQKVEEKCLYDRGYRQHNAVMLKAKKAAHHRATYDPAKAAIERKRRAPMHAEYCRLPEYKRWKSEYDRKRRASEYGPAAEAYGLFLDLTREIKGRMSDYEIRQQNDTLNKRLARSREAQAEEKSRNRDRAA